MPENGTAKAPALELRPAWGPKADGKGFVGVNLIVDGDTDKPIIVGMGMLNALTTMSPEAFQAFQASAKAALVWRMTHRAVLNPKTGEWEPVEKAQGPAKVRPTVGAAF